MGTDLGVIFQLVPLGKENEELEYDVEMRPHELILSTCEGEIRFCIAEKNVLLITGTGVSLGLRRKSSRYDAVFPMSSKIYRVNCSGPDLRYIVSCLQGEISHHAPWEGDRSPYIELCLSPGSDGTFYVMLEEFTGASRPIQEQRQVCAAWADYETHCEAVREEYERWQSAVLPASEEFKRGWELASYITWSCVVPQGGTLTRPSMYMSKNWMTNIWSWDNCFNALALARHNPELAWDQFMIFFDLQDASGMLPDFANDKYAYYGFTKPPVHGWTLSLLLKENPEFFESRLGEVFTRLEAWTNYWFDFTDYREEDLPSYSHGNDAGWDNSTIFAGGVPVTSPDLLSFLIVQMDVLADCAEKLGFADKAKDWKNRADECFQILMERFWNGEAFTLGPDAEVQGDSLILFMPLILGSRLPDEVIQTLLTGLTQENRFLTKHGLATESVSSEFYRDDGYWRGPIWAPATMLLVDAVERCGASGLARDIALRYVRMANDAGMYENYDAQSGRGLRDSAFTWTSSVFLYLANKYGDVGASP